MELSEGRLLAVLFIICILIAIFYPDPIAKIEAIVMFLVIGGDTIL